MARRFETSSFERAFDVTPVIVSDFKGGILLWTQGVARLYRYESSQALGRKPEHLLKTQFPKPLPEIEEQVLDEGFWSGDLLQTRADGRALVVASQWALVRDDQGAPAHVVMTGHDVSERADEIAHRNLLASIVEGSQDAIIGKDLKSRITSWNKAAEAIFGYSEAEMLGQPITRLFPPDRFAEEETILARLKAGELIDHYETERLRKDGRVIDVSLSVSPVRNGAGEVVGASKIVRDITDAKRLQARLTALQAELTHIARLNDMGQMATAIAHELNQPLAALVSYVGGIRRSLDTNRTDRAREGCEQAQDQVMRAAEVVKRIRDFVRKGVRVPERAPIAPLVDGAIQLGLLSHRGQKIRVEVALSDDAAVAVVDRVQVQQVLVNLLRNSAEAMAGRPDQVIRITSRKKSATALEVTVSDNGPGLPREVLDRLFDPFVTTKADGMGVGLSLCRTIIEAQGGVISGANQSAGGAEFHISLPTTERSPRYVAAD